MVMATEMAIGGVVIRRLGAKWFTGVLVLSFILLYFFCPEAASARWAEAADVGSLSLGVSMASLLLVTIITATEVPYDISGRVMLVVLSKPIRRYQYVVGKVLGVMGTGVIYCVCCFAFVAAVLLLRGYNLDMAFATGAAAAVLRVVAVSSAAMFLSVTSSELPTIAGCLIGGIVSFMLNLLALGLFNSGLERAWQLALDPLLYVVPGLMSLTPPPTMLGDLLTGFQRPVGSGSAFGTDELISMRVDNLGLALVYSLIYLLLFLGLSVWTFRKSEKVE